MACNNQGSLFGSSDKYIKLLNGDLVAIEGANTVDRQILNSLRSRSITLFHLLARCWLIA
jgi:hypothetical protein